MSNIVNQSFSGTVGATIASFAGWTRAAAFDSATPPVIDSTGNRLRGNDAGGRVYFAPGVAVADGENAAVVFDVLSAAGSYGILVRGNAESTTGYMAYFTGSQVSILRLYVNGGAAAFATIAAAVSSAPAVANGHAARLTATGTGANVTLAVSVDGTTVLTGTDTGATSAGAALSAFGRAGIYFDTTKSDTAGAHFSSLTFDDPSVASGLTITAPVSGKIVPLSGGTSGTGAISLSGTYSGTAPNQWRLVPDGGSVSVAGFDWQAFSAAPAGGAFAQTIAAVPKLAGWYNVQVRNSAVPGTVYTSSKVGAGAFVAVDGQSNAWLWFSGDARGGDGSLTPSPLLRVTGKQAANAWLAPTGTMNAAIACGNALVAALGCPVGLIDGAWDASGLTIPGANGASGPNGQWVPTTTNAYASSLSAVNAAGGKVIANLWIQGEGDAGASVSQSTYYNALGVLIAQRRSDLAVASLPYVVVTLARDTTGMGDAQREAIKLAQVQKCADANIYRVDRLDLPLADGVHHNPTGYTALGKRCAQAVLAAVGAASQYRGPSIASIARVSSAVFDVNLTHHLGADFTPTSAVTGFRVTDPGADSAVIAVSSAVKQSAAKIRVTLASAPVGLPNFSYLWGANPSITGVVLDDSALTLPLEYNSGVLAVAATATTVTFSVVDATGAPATGLTNLDYAFYDQPRISAGVAPVKYGTNLSISGGTATIDITGVTGLAPGGIGRIEWGDAAGVKLGGGQVAVS